jgi:hypothetical protein
MPSVFWIFAFSFSIFIAGILALYRITKINKAYYPFLLCIWLACINELLNFLFFKIHSNSCINTNIYVLFEAVLIILLFRNLGVINKPKFAFYTILTFLLVVWILENFVIFRITEIENYFRIIYSFIIILLSVTYLNILIGSNKKLSVKNSDFLLCLAFILYYTYKVLVYSFWLYGLKSGQGFLLKVFTIMIYINLFTNLIYALAVLWMPRKIEYTPPY